MEKPHKKLDVWKLLMDFVIDIYRKTEGFPKEERYALTDQIRRAAVSIPSNIAEGAARQTKKEFINYLHIAQGSLSELDTQFEIAKRLSYLSESDWKSFDEQILRIDKMISEFLSISV